jgi:hypothetical protein
MRRRLPLAASLPTRWSSSFWPPVIAWSGASVAIVLWCVVEGWPPFAAGKSWSRADSFWYLGMAKHGYTLARCGSGSGPVAWCGTAGWFPAYPWIVGSLGHLNLPLAPTALILAWLFSFGTVMLLWTAMPSRGSRGSLIAIAYAAVAPGIVFCYAVYPLSLLTFCTAASLLLLGRRRHLLGGLAAALAALSYPLGIVLAAAGGAWLLTDRSLSRIARVRSVAMVTLPTITAGLIFVIDQRLETGRWNAYFLVQRKYGHHLRDPLAAVADAVRGLGSGRLLLGYHVIEGQTLLVTFVLFCVVVELIVRHRSTTRFDALAALWAVCTWSMALMQTNVSIWRGEAALVPLALLVRRLPAPLASAITVAAFVVMIAMTRLYLNNHLN